MEKKCGCKLDCPLHAAAPELLEACKALHRILMQAGFSLQGDAIEAYKKSVAAIAAAEGG